MSPGVFLLTCRYELRVVLVGKNHEAVRVRVDSGESWRVTGGTRFEKIPETGPVPKANTTSLRLAIARRSGSSTGLTDLAERRGRCATINGTKSGSRNRRSVAGNRWACCASPGKPPV